MMSVVMCFIVSAYGGEEPDVESPTTEFSTDWVTNKVLQLGFTKGISAGQAQLTVQ